MVSKSSNIVNRCGRKKRTALAGVLLLVILCTCGCSNEPKQVSTKTFDYIKPIPGPSDRVPPETASKGQVLVGYSDCYSCHKEDKRSVGPAFKDIAKRYPVNEAYMDYLSKKIISGGSGSWGTAVMIPHPQLTPENAKAMAGYILSLRQ